MAEQTKHDFTWINCPHCGMKLFKALKPVFKVEIPCNSCKAIYELESDGERLITRQTRLPKRSRPVNSQYPNKYK